MKIGSFIGCDRKPLTKSEIQNFDKAIRAAFTEHGFSISQPTSTGEWPVNPQYPNAKSRYLGIKNIWIITSQNPIIGRNEDGDRIKFTSLIVEINNELDKDGNEQYQSWIKENGIILYRNCSGYDAIMPDGHFQYGTEVKDFDFVTPAYWIFKKTLLERITPGQLKKIIEKINKIEKEREN